MQDEAKEAKDAANGRAEAARVKCEKAREMLIDWSNSETAARNILNLENTREAKEAKKKLDEFPHMLDHMVGFCT